MTKDIRMNDETTPRTDFTAFEPQSSLPGDDRAEAQQWLRPGEKPFQGSCRRPDDRFDPFGDIPHYL